MVFLRPTGAFLLAPALALLGCSSAKVADPDAGASADAGFAADATGNSDDAGSDPADTGPADTGMVGGGCPALGPLLDEGNGPPRRGDMAFAFDPECRRVLVFYGDAAEPLNCNPAASVFLDDGYAFDVATGRWATIEVSGANRPLRRARSSGAWDPARKRFIVFGGRFRAGTTGAYTFLNDVWAFDPATKTWEELSAQDAAGAPPGRMNTQIVLDAQNNRILVFGGGRVAAGGISFEAYNDTWAFDLELKTWRELGLNGTKPEGRLFHVTAYDPANEMLYIFGGGGADALTAAQFLRDMHRLDLEADAWSAVTPAGEIPAGRIKATMEYDPARSRFVLFGGHDDGALGNDNDIWTFDIGAQAWTRQVEGDVFNAPALGQCDFPADFATIDPNSPERRESHAFSILGDIAVMHAGRTDCGLANDTWVLDLRTFSWQRINNSFTGMTCFRSGRQDCMMPGAKKCG